MGGKPRVVDKVKKLKKKVGMLQKQVASLAGMVRGFTTTVSTHEHLFAHMAERIKALEMGREPEVPFQKTVPDVNGDEMKAKMSEGMGENDTQVNPDDQVSFTTETVAEKLKQVADKYTVEKNPIL